MRRLSGDAAADLLHRLEPSEEREHIAPGAVLLRGFARAELDGLAAAIEAVAAAAPFRHMITPGGFRMSVAMTNCGRAGWITDRRGYRYVANDPLTGRPWPAMPALFEDLAACAAAAAGFADFAPDACLINRYEPGSRLTLHQDRNERDFAQPIVSVSLGLPAIFLFGGSSRNERPRRYALQSGDVAVWGGPARLAFHGVDKLAEGEDVLCGCYRFNLTLRRAL
ncbi:MAG TPA: DNA oxidative demethylase AlkB [Stellaceae bacterium]|nr:DNA oxidative demethylase AlkB [Stellaceae bacterium]